MNVRQLKLITGEEVLCDLVDTEYNEYEDEFLIIRSAYSLVSTEDFESQMRYYTFRPFMMHQYETNKVMALSSGAVICAVTPDKKVIEQYEAHVELFKAEDEEYINGDSDEKKTDPNVVTFKPKLH